MTARGNNRTVITDTSGTNQKCCMYIRALNSGSVERLDSIALSDGSRDYSYRLMFRKWDLYAEVFSALDITGEHGSRAGLTGTPAAETIFAYYALNMTGTSVSMIHMTDLKDPERWERMVREEGITDLILADSSIDPDLFERIVRERSRLGIRRIIVLQIPLREDSLTDEEKMIKRAARRRMREFKGVYFMDKLLRICAAQDISYAETTNDEAAVIAHTSGTVKGIHKPVPLSDKGLNEAAACMLSDKRFSRLSGRAVSMLFMDMSSAYAMTDMVHLTLCFGGRLVVIPGTRYIEEIAEIIGKYSVNVMFATGSYMNAMMRLRNKPNLAALEFVFVGGSHVSAYMKKKYDSFFESCGARAKVTLGYGLSETAGACILSEPDRADDSMGKPLPGVKVKLYNEDEKKYHDLSDGPLRGVLFVNSPSISRGCIDGRRFFDLERIDGEEYLNTYDLVQSDKDGYLYYAGRMNKYFVNNEGIRFDAGLVETAVSAQPGIESCALAPGYDKSMHDTIPVLYVKTDKSSNIEESIETIEETLKKVFISEGLIRETNLPGQCMITTELPLNEGGKVDFRRVLNGSVKGILFKVEPVRDGRALTDIRLVEFVDAPGRRSGLPEELS